MKNTNHAKLTHQQIQNARDLHRTGFRYSTVSETFDVTARAVADILHGRSWKAIPDVPTALPLLPVDALMKLRLRSVKRANDAQVVEYAERLAVHGGLTVAAVLAAWSRKKEKVEAVELSCVGTTERDVIGGMGANFLQG